MSAFVNVWLGEMNGFHDIKVSFIVCYERVMLNITTTKKLTTTLYVVFTIGQFSMTFL